MAHHTTPLTGTLRRLRRGRTLTGVAIDSERLAAIEHGHVIPTVDELRRIARVLDLTIPECRDLQAARHRARFAEVHRRQRAS